MVLQRTDRTTDHYAEELKNRLQQQAVVAELGQKALASQDLQALMDAAAQKVVQTLGVDYCQVLEYDARAQTLLLRAGIGWKDGFIGSARFAAGTASQAGFTLQTTEPVIVRDLRAETRFHGSQLLSDHGVTSGMSIVIPGAPHPFGVFAVHTRTQRDFTAEDVNFLRGIVNVLAGSIERKKIEDVLRDLNQDLDRKVNERTALVRLLQEVTIAANDADTISEAMRVALERITKFTGFPVGHVFVSVGGDTKELISSPIWYFGSSATGYDALRKASDQVKFFLGEGVLGQVLASGQRLWVSDLHAIDIPRLQTAHQLGLEAALFLPVLVKKEIVAILEFFTSEKYEADEDLLDALSNIGTQLGRIVERRRAAKELFEKEQRLVESQHIAQLGSWEWDIKHDLLSGSDVIYQIFGVSPQKFDGSYEGFLDIVHPDDREIVVDAIRSALANASPFRFEHRIKRPDGEVRVLQGRGKVMVDTDGKPVKIIGTEQDITGRKRMEEQVYAQAELLRNVVASLPVILWAVDREGNITFSGKRGLTALGIPSGDALGSSVFTDEYDALGINQHLRRALDGDEFQVDLDYQGMAFNAHFCPVKDSRGSVVGATGLIIDMTERIQVQRALRESERRYRQVMESVKDYAIFTLDPDGYVTSWNPGAERIKGFRAGEVIGKHFSIFYTPEDVKKGEPQLSLQNAVQDGHFENEGWRLRKDGTRYWANVVITPIWDEQGNLQGFSKVVRDITRRRQTEEALRASEARFRTIFEGSAIGIAILDLNGNMLIGNPALQDILGYSMEELNRLTLDQISYTSDQATHQAMFQELADGKRELFRHEGRFRKKDGDVIWGNWAVSLVRDAENQPQYAISMIEDITFRKHMQNELLEVQRQLDAGREQERLRLAQELHDDPLQELYGIIYQIEAVNLMLENPASRDELHLMRDSVQNVIDKLRAICGELRPPALTPFGLESAIREHADTFHSQYPEIRLHLDLAYDGQYLSEQLRLTLFRVYQQAIANVARHSKAKNANVRFEFDEQRAILEIEDDGQGFVVPLNWVNFTRRKHLGLAGAAERAELLGGKLDVTSAPGKGTLVRLIIPIKFAREPEDGG
jgi:PAS domain S-box-containing protein